MKGCDEGGPFPFWAPESLKMVTAAMKLRHLLLGRKAVTNLDSILKSRDITLLTKVRLVKTMVFPLVTYRCERPQSKLSTEELMLLNCGAGKDLDCKSPLDYKEISQS